MRRLIVTAALLLTTATWAFAAADCDQWLPVMAKARQDVRAKRVLTQGQEAIWQEWKRFCQHDPWPQRLTALDNPAEVAQYYDRTPKEGTLEFYRNKGYVFPGEVIHAPTYYPTYYPTTTYTHCTLGRYFSSCTTR
jgi:hypothetical protein